MLNIFDRLDGIASGIVDRVNSEPIVLRRRAANDGKQRRYDEASDSPDDLVIQAVGIITVEPDQERTDSQRQGGTRFVAGAIETSGTWLTIAESVFLAGGVWPAQGWRIEAPNRGKVFEVARVDRDGTARLSLKLVLAQS